MAITVILGIVVIFAAGIAFGIVLLVSAGSRREERDLTLTSLAPDQISKGARVVTGLYVRQRSDLPTEAHRPDVFV
jgi:hypothetical protein